ncbi:MAG: DinB family protein [Micromonosporaceae bacterium]
MTEVQTDEHGRPEPPLEGDEVATLLGFLDYQRATLEWKCRGLSDEQLRVALPPTSMTLGGMLKHLAWVEDYWYTKTIVGEPMPEPWASVDWKADSDWEWHSAADDTGDELRALWADRVKRSRAVVDARLGQVEVEALRESYSAWGGQGRVSLRWVLVHMIEEYARHNGHADLIRESIDGQTGE